MRPRLKDAASIITAKKEEPMSLTPCDALEAIQYAMSGERWTPETLEAIAEIMEAAGYDVNDCDDEGECATCAASIETRCAPCDECGHIDEED